MYPNCIVDLIESFKCLPGIGEKTAERLTFSVLELEEEQVQIFSSSLLNVKEKEVIFTSGSTESNNMAIVGLLEYAKESGKNHFITTAIEHKSVIEAMKFLEKNGPNAKNFSTYI